MVAKKERIGNQLAWGLAALMVAWSVIVLLGNGNWTIAGWDLAIAALAGALPWLGRRFGTRFSRMLLIILVNATILLFAGLFGRNAGTHYCLFPATALPFALFRTQDRKSIAFGVLLPVTLFLVLLISDFSIFPRFEEIPPGTFVYWTTVLSAFGLSFLPLWFFSTANEASEARLESALERAGVSERKYGQIVELLQEGLWRIDAEGVTTYANPALAAMLGYRAEEMVGHSFYEFMDEPARAEAERKFERRRQGASERHEFRFRHRDGSDVFTLMSASTIYDSQQQFAGAIAMVINLTETRAKEKLIEEQRAKILAAAKLSSLGEMAGGIAHEINNPLSAITLKTSLIERRLGRAPLDHEALKRDASDIRDIVARIERIIRGLRTFSRDDGGEPFEKAPIARILEDTLSLCRERFLNHGIYLKVEEFDPELCLDCRPTQISQVLLNFLNNAFDAIKKLPSERRLIEIRIRPQADRSAVLLAVKDQGTGIPPEVQEKILQPFFTTKPVGEGTGLGLSISKGIIEAHHGHLSFESVPGESTEFRVLLPLHQPALPS